MSPIINTTAPGVQSMSHHFFLLRSLTTNARITLQMTSPTPKHHQLLNQPLIETTINSLVNWIFLLDDWITLTANPQPSNLSALCSYCWSIYKIQCLMSKLSHRSITVIPLEVTTKSEHHGQSSTFSLHIDLISSNSTSINIQVPLILGALTKLLILVQQKSQDCSEHDLRNHSKELVNRMK